MISLTTATYSRCKFLHSPSVCVCVYFFVVSTYLLYECSIVEFGALRAKDWAWVMWHFVDSKEHLQVTKLLPWIVVYLVVPTLFWIILTLSLLNQENEFLVLATMPVEQLHPLILVVLSRINKEKMFFQQFFFITFYNVHVVICD